jgi:hypothetical protein
MTNMPAAKAVERRAGAGACDAAARAELIGLAEVRLNKATGGMQQFGKAVGGPGAARTHQPIAPIAGRGRRARWRAGLFTIIAQQGPQIADVLATSKSSLGDFVSTAVSGAGRFLAAWGPVALAVAAVARLLTRL